MPRDADDVCLMTKHLMKEALIGVERVSETVQM